MSSKRKNLDDELSDISSDEENIVQFASKNTKTKDKKNKKKEEGNPVIEEKNKKILSKKTKREKEEKNSDSDSDNTSEENEKKKNKKSAQNNYEKEEKKENKMKSKNKKNDKKKVEDSSEEEDKKEKNKNIKKEESKKEKKKKIIKEKSDSDESDSEKEIKNKNVENKSEEEENEDSNKAEKSDSEEEVKPKKKKKTKKVENSDDEENKKEKRQRKDKEEKEDNEDKEDKEDKEDNEDKEENDEPKLVKNELKEEEKKERKSYNSGTWPELFVNNLSYKTTEESLKNYFSKYGEVESTKIVYDKESGRSKGVGFCKFCDSSSAAEAIKDNDNLFLDGRPIAVSYSNDKKGSAKVRKSNFKGDKNYQGEKFSVFIGNLSFKTNEDGIKNLFEDCGKIIDIRIAKKEDGKPRGFAHVDFDSKEALENALEKNGYKLDGRELRIDITTNKPSSNKGVFGEHSYKKNKNLNNEENDIEKAKKTGKIINTGSKSQKIENSDDEDDDDDE